jgi:predicted alpha/beta superfamily hydrolase
MAISTSNQNQTITIQLHTPRPMDGPVYISGNFNNWKGQDSNYQLSQIGPNDYQFVFEQTNGLPQPLHYKFLRGDWDREELDEYGNTIDNRVFHWNSEEAKVSNTVVHWKTNGQFYNEKFRPLCHTLDENFEIPQLIRTRRITALLPHNYHESDKRYPVLYLQDGQNLFDDYAPFGNWAVDKRMAVMAEQGMGDLIIVAIDHAEDQRIAEFTPSYKTRLGKGDGKKYVRFLADTLKPYVDKQFRTKPERLFTGIGGSSMGGLISIYAGMMYPEVYSKLLVFSPSLWVAPNIHFHAINFDESLETKVYLYAGEGESANMVPNIQRFKSALENQGVSNKFDFNVAIDPKGQHTETRWGVEFPHAAKWLYFN